MDPLPIRANIAHRGASAYAPENTRAAFVRAAQQGADYVELDVRQTRDGHVVVLHDATLARTTNVGERFPGRTLLGVEAFTRAEIETLDAGAWFAANGAEQRPFAGERVLLLDEAIGLAEAHNVGLWIEIKPEAVYPDLEERVAGVLAEHGWAAAGPKRLVVQSFSVASVQKMGRIAPGIARLQLVGGTDPLEPAALDAIRDYAHGLAPARALATPELVRSAHARNLCVYPWTFRGPDPAALETEMRRALDAGADGLITDNPDVLASILSPPSKP